VKRQLLFLTALIAMTAIAGIARAELVQNGELIVSLQ
jgi:hypothetical protein